MSSEGLGKLIPNFFCLSHEARNAHAFRISAAITFELSEGTARYLFPRFQSGQENVGGDRISARRRD